MNPTVQLYSYIHHYLSGNRSLTELEQALVPLLPYFAPRAAVDPAARLALEIDALIIDVGLGEASEDDVRSLLESLPSASPTVQLELGSNIVVSGSTTGLTRHLFVSCAAFVSSAALAHSA